MAVIKLKRSDTPGNTPTTLEHGEVAINIPDKKIYIGSGDTNDTAVLIVNGNAVGGGYTAPTLGSTTLTSGATITSIAGLTSVTSTSFVGALTGNASTVTNGVYTTDTGTVTNTMLAGSIANNKLTNSTISGVSLGSNLNALTIGTGLSGTSFNGSGAVTIAIDSTVATLTGVQTLTNKTLTSPTISNLYLSDGLILVEGTTNDTNEMSLVVGALTADRTITFPNATGTVITTGNLSSITSIGTLSDQVVAPSFADTYSFNQTYRTTTTATTANQTIATVSGVYSGVDGMYYPAFEVTVSAWDTVALRGEMLKMLVMQDGTNTVNTQYGLIRTGATSIVSSYTTGLTVGANKNLQIKATPLSANSTNFTTTIRAIRST